MQTVTTSIGQCYKAVSTTADTLKTSDGDLVLALTASDPQYFVAGTTSTTCADDTTIALAGGVLTPYNSFSVSDLDANLSNYVTTSSFVDHASDTSIHLTESDLSGYATTTELNSLNILFVTLLSEKASTATLQAHTNLTSIHVNTAEKGLWNSTAESIATHAADTTIHVTADERSNWASPRCLPDWTNAVSLAASDFPYTALANGWVVGYATSLNDVSLIFKINGVAIALDSGSGDSAQMHILVSDGDIISATTSLSVSAIKFVPLKD